MAPQKSSVHFSPLNTAENRSTKTFIHSQATYKHCILQKHKDRLCCSRIRKIHGPLHQLEGLKYSPFPMMLPQSLWRYIAP